LGKFPACHLCLQMTQVLDVGQYVVYVMMFEGSSKIFALPCQ
jgi:hypothetical protein